MAAPRILLCGDVLGRLNNLFKRVSTVNKSTGPFDALLCVGQFFPNSSDQLDELSQYIDGHQPVPIPTYFIGDYGVGAVKYLSIALMDSTNQGFKMDGLKICKNLYWLKGSGKFSLHGLSVAYLSGRCGSGSQPTGVYSEDDVDALRAFAEEPGVIDLFLTNEWPTGILNGSDTSGVTPEFLHPSGTDATISQLAAELKPRYHIAGSKGVFYVREPYSNDEAVHVTRFLGLAPVGNKDKQAIPVPLSKVSDIKQHFASGAEKLGFEFPVIGPSDHGEDARKLLRTEFDGKSSFFYAELPDATVLSHSIKEKQKFPAQFGREVLAGLFNIEDKADWRNCELSKEDELQMAEGFKKRFEEFDPTQ